MSKVGRPFKRDRRRGLVLEKQEGGQVGQAKGREIGRQESALEPGGISSSALMQNPISNSILLCSHEPSSTPTILLRILYRHRPMRPSLYCPPTLSSSIFPFLPSFPTSVIPPPHLYV